MIRSKFVRGGFLVGAAALAFAAVAEAAGPYQFYAVTPCRIVDTRNPPVGDGTGGPALTGGGFRNMPIAGRCGVPTDAKAAALNVTIASPTGPGHLTIYPYATPTPVVSTLNWAAGEPAIANGAIVPLTTDPSFSITVFGGLSGGQTTHVVLDVTGYFK
jgi:hypothetical protein